MWYNQPLHWILGFFLVGWVHLYSRTCGTINHCIGSLVSFPLVGCIYIPEHVAQSTTALDPWFLSRWLGAFIFQNMWHNQPLHWILGSFPVGWVHLYSRTCGTINYCIGSLVSFPLVGCIYIPEHAAQSTTVLDPWFLSRWLGAFIFQNMWHNQLLHWILGFFLVGWVHLYSRTSGTINHCIGSLVSFPLVGCIYIPEHVAQSTTALDPWFLSHWLGAFIFQNMWHNQPLHWMLGFFLVGWVHLYSRTCGTINYCIGSLVSFLLVDAINNSDTLCYRRCEYYFNNRGQKQACYVLTGNVSTLTVSVHTSVLDNRCLCELVEQERHC